MFSSGKAGVWPGVLVVDACRFDIGCQFFPHVLVLHDLLQEVLQVGGAVGLGEQLLKLVPDVQEGRDVSDLAGHRPGLEVLERLEIELDGSSLSSPVMQVGNLEYSDGRTHPFQDLVEVVSIDLDELAILE